MCGCGSFFVCEMSTIEQKFMRATQAVADGEIQLTDTQRNIFYGLQKQAIDGDCNVAEPPRYVIPPRWLSQAHQGK